MPREVAGIRTSGLDAKCKAVGSWRSWDLSDTMRVWSKALFPMMHTLQHEPWLSEASLCLWVMTPGPLHPSQDLELLLKCLSKLGTALRIAEREQTPGTLWHLPS